jgi:hypothetical protein
LGCRPRAGQYVTHELAAAVLRMTLRLQGVAEVAEGGTADSGILLLTMAVLCRKRLSIPQMSAAVQASAACVWPHASGQSLANDCAFVLLLLLLDRPPLPSYPLPQT